MRVQAYALLADISGFDRAVIEDPFIPAIRPVIRRVNKYRWSRHCPITDASTSERTFAVFLGAQECVVLDRVMLTHTATNSLAGTIYFHIYCHSSARDFTTESDSRGRVEAESRQSRASSQNC